MSLARAAGRFAAELLQPWSPDRLWLSSSSIADQATKISKKQEAIRFPLSDGPARTSGCFAVASNGKLQHRKEVPCGQIQKGSIPNNRPDGTIAGGLRRGAAAH